MGDYGEIGFTRQQYRTRLKRLREWGLITTRSTPRGTIVRLHSTVVFDLGLSPNDCLTSEQKAKIQPPVLRGIARSSEPTANQPTNNSQPLTNNDRRKERKKNHGTALGNSIPGVSSNANRSSVSFCSAYQNQNQPVQNHVKWPEFATWCRSKGGPPTESGFWKWLGGQKPQWRNKVRQNFDERGYVLEGKFFTPEEANQLAVKNPEIIGKFRRAVKRDGKTRII